MNPGPTSPSLSDESDIRPAALAAEPVPPSSFIHGLAAPVLKYLEARGLLLGIETQEALQQVVTLFVWLAVGATAAFAGWLLLATSLVGALTGYLGWSWVKATAIVGVAHILVTLTTAFVTMNRLTTARWFADSLNELKKDRAWLKTPTTQN